MSGTDEELITRRPARERPQREVHREEPEKPASLVIEDSGHDDITPEEALADSRRLLQEADRRTADAQKRQREAERRAADSQAQAQQAAAGRQSDRQTVVTQAIDAAKAEGTTAAVAYKLARESGDIEAEIAASQAIADARMRLHEAQREHDQIKAQPAAQPKQGNQFTPETQRWLDDHPAFFSDKRYERLARAAHDEAIRSGHRDGSQSYVDYIDGIMEEEYGEGHGQAPQPAAKGDRPVRESRASGGGTLPPSRRGNGQSSAGAGKTVKTGLGPLTLQVQSDGSRRIKFSSPDQRANFEEGAKISFPHKYDRNPAQALADYVNEHIDHAQEIEAGGRGDIVYGEGSRHE